MAQLSNSVLFDLRIPRRQFVPFISSKYINRISESKLKMREQRKNQFLRKWLRIAQFKQPEFRIFSTVSPAGLL
ncbi:MAG: hypothetical protein A2503_16785 [Burkholderiales bacterium RIFOXYD12_FULL_59_19]|nr:MAG: hypothetical protein A2503_16785 [Burkholderiales bacterium RIFOXYD12_FULL_59_19]